MAPPSRIHQEISYQISRFLGEYIESTAENAACTGSFRRQSGCR
ncbi:MAG: hypothetical protein ACLTSZ_09740 [Lachnospiraceae bacterium]